MPHQCPCVTHSPHPQAVPLTVTTEYLLTSSCAWKRPRGVVSSQTSLQWYTLVSDADCCSYRANPPAAQHVMISGRSPNDMHLFVGSVEVVRPVWLLMPIIYSLHGCWGVCCASHRQRHCSKHHMCHHAVKRAC